MTQDPRARPVFHPAREGTPPNPEETRESMAALHAVIAAAADVEYHTKATQAAQWMANDVRMSPLGTALDKALHHHLPLVLARLTHLEGDTPFVDRQGTLLQVRDVAQVPTEEGGRPHKGEVTSLWMSNDTAMATVAGGLGDWPTRSLLFIRRPDSPLPVRPSHYSPAARIVTDPSGLVGTPAPAEFFADPAGPGLRP